VLVIYNVLLSIGNACALSTGKMEPINVISSRLRVAFYSLMRTQGLAITVI